MTQSRIDKQKAEELRFLNIFKSVFDGFPGGDIVTLSKEDEPPDFAITNDTEKIGIEVTRIVKSTEMYKEEAEQELTVSAAEKIYKSKGYPPVDVSVYFRDNSNLTRNGRLHLSNEIASLVAGNLPRVNDYISFMESLPLARILPECVIDIRVALFSSVDVNCWSVSGMGWTQTEFVSELQERLQTKGDKINHCKTKCDRYWIVCVAEDLRDSSFFNPSEATQGHQYLSVFDRAFFLNAGSRKWFELNCVTPPNTTDRNGSQG